MKFLQAVVVIAVTIAPPALSAGIDRCVFSVFAESDPSRHRCSVVFEALHLFNEPCLYSESTGEWGVKNEPYDSEYRSIRRRSEPANSQATLPSLELRMLHSEGRKNECGDQCFRKSDAAHVVEKSVALRTNGRSDVPEDHAVPRSSYLEISSKNDSFLNLGTLPGGLMLMGTVLATLGVLVRNQAVQRKSQ